MGKLIQFIEHILFVGLPSCHRIIECGDEADIASLIRQRTQPENTCQITLDVLTLFV